MSAVAGNARAVVPPVAYAAAAEAVGALPALSTPEEIAEAALNAAWPLAPRDGRRTVTDIEVELVRRLVAEFRLTRDQVATLLGCNRDRVNTIMRGRIRMSDMLGRVHNGNRRGATTSQQLAEIVADACRKLGR